MVAGVSLFVSTFKMINSNHNSCALLAFILHLCHQCSEICSREVLCCSLSPQHGILHPGFLQDFKILANFFCYKAAYVSAEIFCFFRRLASSLTIRIDSNPTLSFSLVWAFFRELTFLTNNQQWVVWAFNSFLKYLKEFANVSQPISPFR